MANALKYMDIVKWTTNQIALGALKPKDKFLSEAALGKRFSCSRQTVRRALAVLEQEGRVRRVQGSGTFITAADTFAADASAARRSGSEGRSMTVGLVSTFRDNFIFPSIIRGVESVLSAEGFAVQLASTKNLVAGEMRALQIMLDRPLDGLIVEPTRSALPCANLDLYQRIAQKGIPLVFIDSFYPELEVPYVAMDDVKAGYLATRHLIEMGHRNIMGVFPHANRQGHLRYLGYVKALTEQGLHVQDDLVCWYSRMDMIKTTHREHLWECVSAATASLCYNDTTALSIIDVLRENGKRVPDDFSVVGIDNSELAAFASLTSVAHPAELLGEAAAELLRSMMNGSQGKTILFPPKLVERGSVRRMGS